MFGFIKATSQDIPAGEAVFFRSFFAIPVLTIWLIWRGVFPSSLKAVNPMGHVWRGLMGSFAMACGFFAIGLLPLPEVVAIGYAAPLMVTMLAAMFLGEKIRLVRLSALLLGMFGVMLVLSPRLTILDADTTSQLESIGALVALMAAVFSALAQVFARKLVATETTGSIVFYFSLMSSTLALLTIPFGWEVPNKEQLLLSIWLGSAKQGTIATVGDCWPAGRCWTDTANRELSLCRSGCDCALRILFNNIGSVCGLLCIQ